MTINMRSRHNLLLTAVGIIFSALTAFHNAAYAHNKVVVIPLFDELAKTANVVTVAKEGADFTDVRAALLSLESPSVDNPYVVLIGPGQFEIDEQLRIRPGVNLIGSGSEITTLNATIDEQAGRGDGAVIRMDTNSSVSGVRIQNRTETDAKIYGIYTEAVHYLHISDVAVDIDRGHGSTGIQVQGAYMHFENIKIVVRRVTDGSGFLVGNSRNFPFRRAVLENVEIVVEGDGLIQGLVNYHRGLKANNVRVTVRGDDSNVGFFNATGNISDDAFPPSCGGLGPCPQPPNKSKEYDSVVQVSNSFFNASRGSVSNWAIHSVSSVVENLISDTRIEASGSGEVYAVRNNIGHLTLKGCRIESSGVSLGQIDDPTFTIIPRSITAFNSVILGDAPVEGEPLKCLFSARDSSILGEDCQPIPSP